MMHIKLGCRPEHRGWLSVNRQADLLEKLDHVVTREIVRMQAAADKVAVEDSILDYLMTIVTETRRHEKIRLGVSTRGAQFFLKAARAHAYYDGRDYVIPDDIKILAPLVLGHRLILKTKKFISDAEMIINELLDIVPVPV
jgi:MoxR-like ATPase